MNDTTLTFGTATEASMVSASLETLSAGYHMILITKSASKITIQIDDGLAVEKDVSLSVGNGLQLGTRWTGTNNNAVQATGLLIDEFLMYNTVLTADEIASLVEAYPPAIPSEATASSTETTVVYSNLSWSIASANIGKLTLVDGATLTIDQIPSFNSLQLISDGSVNVVLSSSAIGTPFAELSAEAVSGATTLEISAETDVTTLPTYLGFASMKKSGSSNLSLSSLTSAITSLEVVEGRFTWSGSGEYSLTHNRQVKATGATAEIKIVNGDGTGWSSSGGSITVADGATVIYAKRDTANTPYILNKGKILLEDAGNGGRAIDFFNASEDVDDITVLAEDTATETSPTESSLVATGNDFTTAEDGSNSPTGHGILLIRTGDLKINVAANAKFTMDGHLASDGPDFNAGGTPGKLVKKGAGVMVMTDTTDYTGTVGAYSTGTTVEAGTLIVATGATLGTGDVEISEGATLELADTSNINGNDFIGAGTIRKSSVDALTLTATNLAEFTGTIEVTAGAITLPLAQAKTATMANGTTLKVVLTAEEQFSDQNVTKEGVTVYFYSEDGSTPLVTDSEGNALPGAYTAPTKTWTISSADPVNWSAAIWTGGTPGDTDAACIDVGEYDVTVTMDAADTLKSLQIKGTTGRLTLTGSNALTVTDLLDVKVNVDVTSTVSVLPETVIESGATLAYEVPADTTVAIPYMSGVGTFAKKGGGTAQFSASETNSIAADGITIELHEGTYQTWLYGSDTNPRLKDATVKFVNSGVTFASHGWIVLDGTVTFDVPATVTDAKLVAANGYVPSLKGETATLVKTGDGDFKAAFDNIQTIQINGGAIVVDGTKTMPGVIAGAGKVKTVAESVVTLSGTNTYTGGTDIVEGATLKITNPNALGTTGTITGAGVLEISGTYNGSDNVDPIVNKNGLTAETWTGTVRYTTAGHQAHFYLDSVGNANSEIEFAGATGFFYKGGAWSETASATVRLTGEGLQMTNGSSGNTSNMKLFIPKLVGAGKLQGPGGSNNWNYTVVIDDASEFAGDIYLPTGHATQFGVIIGTDTLPSGYSASNYWKHITIVEGGVAKIAEGKTWTPAANSQVKVYGTIGGKGTVATALAFQDGAMLDATEGALTASGTVSYGGALTVKVAENATFPVAILNKEGVEAPTNYTIQQGETIVEGFRIVQIADGLAVTGNVTVADLGEYSNITTAIDAIQTAQLTEATVTVATSFEESLTIPEGLTITLNGVALSGGEITVATGAKLIIGAVDVCANVTIVNNGTVQNASGIGRIKIPAMSGTGNLTIDDTLNLVGDLTISGEVTLTGGHGLYGSANINGPSIILVYGSVVKDASDTASTMTVTVAEGKKITGSGVVNAPVTFADGAVIDATAEKPTYNDAVTLAGALTVKVAEVTDAAILTATDGVSGTPTATAIIVNGEDKTTDYVLEVKDNALYIVEAVQPEVEVTTQDALATALGTDGVTKITITGNLSIDKALTLKDDQTLIIPEGVTVTATAGPLVVAGTIEVYGTLNGSALPYGTTGLVPSQGGLVTIGDKGTVVMPKAWEGAGLKPGTANLYVVGDCEEGATIIIGDNEYWKNTADGWVLYPAKIGTAFYATLAEAVDAGGAVTLVADVELTAFVRITKDVTLDLNGKTITAPSITSGGILVIGDYNNGQTYATVTITGEGAITSGAYCVNISYGKLTIDSDAAFTGVDTAVQIQRGDLVINTGTYEVTPGEGNQFNDYRYTINKLDKYATEATVTINGGKFYQFNPANNLAEGEGTNFAKAGYIGQQDADGWYTLVEAPVEAPKPANGGTAELTEATDQASAEAIVAEMNQTVEPLVIGDDTVALEVKLVVGGTTEAPTYTAQLAFADETAAAAVLTPEVGVAEDSTAEPIAITADGVQLTIAKSVEGLWYGYKTGATLAEVMAAEINTDVAFTKGDGQELTLPKVTGAQFFKVVVLPYNPTQAK